MKIDRLLAMVIYLLNRELVSASVLAERFGVTVRTIQRDMEALELAGIPIYAVQGPHGGYGIMDRWKMDRQMVNTDDLYYIITALEGVGATFPDGSVGATLEKMKALLPGGPDGESAGLDMFGDHNRKLSVDFSLLGGDPRRRAEFAAVKRAVEQERVLRFSYTNNRLQTTERDVEAMTLVFRWRAWYLFGYCQLKQDYRLFRVSRIKDPQMLDVRFRRREHTFEQFIGQGDAAGQPNWVDLVLRFDPAMRPIVEEFYPEECCSFEADGGLVVRTRYPEDSWVYGHILSYGMYVEVLEPEHIRGIVAKAAASISEKYQT